MSGLRPQTNSFVVSVGSRDQQERGMGVGTRETAYAVVDVHILTSRDVIEDFEIIFSGRCVRQPGREGLLETKAVIGKGVWVAKVY